MKDGHETFTVGRRFHFDERAWRKTVRMGANSGMRWVAIFDDNEGLDAIRKEHSAAHFDYLGANRDKIIIAGGLRPAPGGWYCGGLWVLEVDSSEEAVRLIEQDPYFRLGLRKGYRLLVWGKAPCYGTVSL